ncbi:MAG: hypothetical protein COA42_21370 [Alteromonadaceae bacterium]|nr:MAG: hypothetical protein COA42_21370 [Alteromonadaceae bacterium]
MQCTKKQLKKRLSGKVLLGVTVFSILAISGQSVLAADSLGEALSNGTVSGNLRLRFEDVGQDNALQDATALTLRTRIAYETGEVSGFSAMIEFEDSRIVLGQDEFSVPPTQFNMRGNSPSYSVIADPEVTELEQGYIKYKSKGFTAKLGRQVITHDNHRFIGHVGWRQDRQTFDALALSYNISDDLSVSYNYIYDRNRIFAEAQDVAANDHIFNIGYKTPVGKLSAYAYLLEADNTIDNSLDTIGLRFSGKTKGDMKFLYSAEYARQTFEANGGFTDIDVDADYLMLEGGIAFNKFTFKAGYELLGSDSGVYGFQTPLATLHKFNGWADIFLGTPAEGLEDLSLSASYKIAGGKVALIYHTFSADESSTARDDFGDEIDFVFSTKFGKHYNAGVKYAAYSADDHAVDTDKLWVWVGASF